MKLFVKFPFVSLVVLCGFAQAQYGNYETILDEERASEKVREQSPPQGQDNIQNKKINIDETEGVFDVKVRSVVGEKEYEEKRGYYDSQANQFVSETCTGITTSFGECVAQEVDRISYQPKRTPSSATKKDVGDFMQLEPNSFPE